MGVDTDVGSGVISIGDLSEFPQPEDRIIERAEVVRRAFLTTFFATCFAFSGISFLNRSDTVIFAAAKRASGDDERSIVLGTCSVIESFILPQDC